MSSLSYAVRDSVTMLRRDLRHSQRYPLMTISSVLMPIFMLLLFVYVFGGAIGIGNYINYVFPGIIVMTIGSGCGATAVNVNADMAEGIIARFRTMAISRASVLTGQVAGSVLRTLVSMALVFGVALLLGFRPKADFGEWLVVVAVILMVIVALTWMAVALGLATKTPGGANGSTLILQFGPFISSAFVQPETMPGGLRWFAENQPFTPIIDTLRGLLTGTPVGDSAVVAIIWCVVIALGGYFWARSLFNR